MEENESEPTDEGFATPDENEGEKNEEIVEDNFTTPNNAEGTNDGEETANEENGKLKNRSTKKVIRFRGKMNKKSVTYCR